VNYLALVGGLGILAGSLSGCGGGGGGGDGLSAPIIGVPAAVIPEIPPVTTQTFAYVPLAVGTISVFSLTSVTNFNNTINQTIQQKVVAVNPDGSSSSFEDDPTNNIVNDHATDYSIFPTTYSDDSSDRVTQFVQQPPVGSPVVCTYSPHGIGPTYPLRINSDPLPLDNTWAYNYVYQCNGQPLNYFTSGSLVGTETITVPAGTFSTFKTQSITTGPYGGTTGVATATTWRDTANGHVIKAMTGYSYGGDPIEGARVSISEVLQSRQ
jgi:hypothetical protein